MGAAPVQGNYKATSLQLIKGDVTAIFVSYNLAAITEICSKAAWLDGGEIKAEEESARLIADYLNYF